MNIIQLIVNGYIAESKFTDDTIIHYTCSPDVILINNGEQVVEFLLWRDSTRTAVLYSDGYCIDIDCDMTFSFAKRNAVL